ncbi:MAG: Holliday junction branch migration protein RuvA [Desulfovibrionaceae bacterium]
MIGYLSGILLYHTNDVCLIITNSSVGYEVYANPSTIRNLSMSETPLHIHIVTIVKEDSITLFGFSTLEEKNMFLLLTSISKIGAKTALTILETFTVDDIKNLVLHGDPLTLTKVSGIGNKTAQHIFLELQYKLNSLPNTHSHIPFIHKKNETGTLPAPVLYNALDALKQLGYEEYQVLSHLKALLSQEPAIELSKLIKETLQKLASHKEGS